MIICDICQKELPTAVRRHENESGVRFFTKDGKFAHTHLSRDRAQVIGAKGHVGAIRKKRDTGPALAAAVLGAIDAPTDEQARAEAVKQLVTALSEVAAGSKGAASVSAISALAARAGELLGGTAKLRKPIIGETCALCGLSTQPVSITCDARLVSHWLNPSLVIPVGEDTSQDDD